MIIGTLDFGASQISMQQHFARLGVRMNEMLDQIEQNEEVLRWVLPQTLRQVRRVPVALNHEELGNEFGDKEEDPIEEVGKYAPQRTRQVWTPILSLNTCIYPMGVTLTHRSHMATLGSF